MCAHHVAVCLYVSGVLHVYLHCAAVPLLTRPQGAVHLLSMEGPMKLSSVGIAFMFNDTQSWELVRRCCAEGLVCLVDGRIHYGVCFASRVEIVSDSDVVQQ